MRSTDDDRRFERRRRSSPQAAALLAGARTVASTSASPRDRWPTVQQNFIDFSPFIGVLNPLAPPIAVSFDDDGNVIGTCTYGAAYEGPPGCVHGGFIAAGFDEVLGFAQAYSGTPGMTGSLNISYRSPTPLSRAVRYVGRLDRVEGRKIYCSATLHDGDTLCAEAEGLFISMKPEVFQRLLAAAARPTARRTSTPPG